MKHFGKIILLLMLGIVSCTDNTKDKNTTRVNNFPELEHIKGHQILDHEFQLASFQIIDSLIIVSAARDTLFHIYTKDEKFITSFGRKGKGPTEFQRPPYIKNIWKDGDTIKSLIYNENKRRPVLINFSESIHEEKSVGKELNLSSDLAQSYVGEIFYSESDRYIGLYYDQYNKKLDEHSGGFIYKSALDDYELFSLKYLTIEPYDPIGEMNLNFRAIAQATNWKKLYTAMKHAPIIEKINVQDLKASKYVIGNDLPQEEFELEDFKNRELPEYFLDIYVTDEFVYLLESEDSPLNSDTGQRIKVMDRSGNPVSQYEISDDYALDWLVVDEAEKMFYGLSWDRDSIYRFAYGESS